MIPWSEVKTRRLEKMFRSTQDGASKWDWREELRPDECDCRLMVSFDKRLHSLCENTICNIPAIIIPCCKHGFTQPFLFFSVVFYSCSIFVLVDFNVTLVVDQVAELHIIILTSGQIIWTKGRIACHAIVED